MQIEEVIGGVDGNTSAQAIQLRLRGGGQNQVQNASLWAADATGSNRVLVLNIASFVPNSAAGARVLVRVRLNCCARVAYRLLRL